ncbi:FHA domain-containing protein [Pseudoduganella violaceinigra]|uniref:FHA domain-containing protein n=1 Tax=Pseudoduganella violaceinigra TaxID=246602 RepID=UPI00040A4471|nr:FHA domain-containing protein [Pseudoduganella violaceinigra]
MNGPFFIETLARNGDVLHRHRVDKLPITIGRGYNNDFILDDAHTAPTHAVVELAEDGALVMRDLGSQNGIVVHGKRQGSVPINGTTVLRLGHTRLRVRDAAFPVEAEVADTTMHAWEGGAPALAGLALIALFVGVTEALSDTGNFQAIRYLLVIATGVGVGTVWSGVWALANRLFGGHARLGRHLFILGSGLVASGAWKALSSVLAYAWSAEVFTRYGNHVVMLILVAMIYNHLRTIKPHKPRAFITSCAVFVVLGSGLILMRNYEAAGRLRDELYMSVMLPPEVRQSKDHSVDEFIGDAAKLKAAADAARQSSKLKKDDEDDDD